MTDRSGPPPGPTGSAAIDPRTASYLLALLAAVHVIVCLSEAEVTFEANLPAARAARLTLSSKVLRLATGVLQ